MRFQNDNSDDVSFEDDRNSPGDDVSRMNTEDSLLSSKASSVTIHKSGDVACCTEGDVSGRCCNPKSKIIIGTLLTIWGVSTLIWTPFDISLKERLRMRPGLPAFDWWQSPPDEVLLKVYIFNITNVDRFLSGEDAKLNLQEIGPIVYREKLLHTNVTFNDNGTLTYVATRKAIYLPEENNIDLNQTITVANLPVLGMASYFWDSPFFEKFGFNMLVSSSNANVTTQMTIYNYLWNYTEPIVEMGKNIAPKLVPVNNLGVLARIYENFSDTVTVYVGTENGNEKFFLIDKYDGSEYLPSHGDKCEDKVVNSTEGVAYPQYLTKNSIIRYWRKTLCFVTSLLFEYEKEFYGVNTYKYTLANNTYDRTEPEEKDCYKMDPVLPSGLRDTSQCFWDFPIGTSFPHFLYGDPKLKDFVDGLQPEKSKHESYVYVEPTIGIPITSRARSQSNLILRKLEGFNGDIDKFSEQVIPMFWADYHQVGLPWYIVSMMYFTVKILPIFQRVWTALLFISAVLLINSATKEHAESRKSYLMKNKVIQYEREVFLKA
ncbi:scavenger receptor class B member 1-like [Harmonia axyridis]|uniref:scavenger receptor class B member 1-like n=1 Tax=Harmonia axyridis TaxID=115357 RepID=UPI001E27763A|nr:scavenger receptor class B member 1-like [Harmonia axyridis]XP_045469205.1 scavenger receptor class B member 1-like [Harmonia axyridis]